MGAKPGGVFRNYHGEMMRSLQNILVTGSAGFIDANLIRMLFEKTAEFSGRIINLDALTYAGNRERLEDRRSVSAGSGIFLNTGIRRPGIGGGDL
jgi:dTDP-glucose 4,6-dehydratase